MGSTRRTILAAGAAAAATAAVPRAFAQQAGKGGTGKFYEKGSVRIYYEEAGAGFALMLLPGGGLNSTISFFTGNSPFNAIEEFKGEYRCIAADLRNAPSGQSTGPVEVDRPWDSYADDQLGGPHTAGRRPVAPISPSYGVRDARAKGRNEHLSLEGTQGADSSGGAPNSFLPQGASACLEAVYIR
jgi:hypothetical protein